MVRRSGTIVLGLGVATLTAVRGAVPLRVGDVGGVDIAGIMIDAGPVNSPLLLQVGTGRHERDDADRRRSDPTVLHDVYFRVGGPHVGRATVSLEVNSDDVLLDHIWAWRADHGVPGSVGWDGNTATTGVVVNGDNVPPPRPFGGHYPKDNLLCAGENCAAPSLP